MSQTHTLLLEAENKTENDAAAAQLKFDFERLASRATKPRLTSRKGEFSEAARLWKKKSVLAAAQWYSIIN